MGVVVFVGVVVAVAGVIFVDHDHGHDHVYESCEVPADDSD